MKRTVANADHLYRILDAGMKVVKPPLYEAVLQSSDMRRWRVADERRRTRGRREFVRKLLAGELYE